MLGVFNRYWPCFVKFSLDWDMLQRTTSLRCHVFLTIPNPMVDYVGKLSRGRFDGVAVQNLVIGPGWLSGLTFIHATSMRQNIYSRKGVNVA